ncbi:hypothetical protein B0H10DRAFT_1962960 [Mycena sp. CBHHK59/15]|nr:hypothetical protein B0H10DRAFT_1962960 [Mycena sp. CBHHK59/15]
MGIDLLKFSQAVNNCELTASTRELHAPQEEAPEETGSRAAQGEAEQSFMVWVPREAPQGKEGGGPIVRNEVREELSPLTRVAKGKFGGRIVCVAMVTVLVNPTPQPRLTIPAAVAAIYPDASSEQQLAIFQDCAELYGGPEVAEKFFRECQATFRNGIVFGALSPPPGVDLRSIDVDHLTIFYHSTFPESLQNSNPFTWNFYIGLRGQGPQSIMREWNQKGIVVRIAGLTGKWEVCNALTVLQRTRVQISFTDRARKVVTRELEFPADPRIPVLHLP